MRNLVAFLTLSAACLCAQQRYPAGTAFTENFGNTTVNPQLCPDGSTVACTQLWTTLAGSGAQIVPASNCASGVVGNALYLPSAATALKLNAYGTLPLIPANSGFTVKETVCVPSYPASNTPSVIQLFSNQTSTSEIFINLRSTGFSSNPGTVCAKPAATFHEVRVTTNGAATQFLIDGVQCGTNFSDPGNPVGSVVVNGSTQVGVYIQSISITGTTINGSWPLSAFVDFAGQTGNTVNAANLYAGTHCGNALSSGWSVNTLTNVSFTFISGGQSFPAAASVCGVSYPGTSGTVLDMHVASGSSSSGAWTLQLYSNYVTVAVGAMISLVPTGTFSTAGNIDFLVLKGNSGTPSYNGQFYSGSGTNFVICAENNIPGGGTEPCTANPIKTGSGNYYWVWTEITAGTQAYLWVFDGSGNLVQRLAYAGTMGTNVPGTIDVSLGKIGTETIQNAADVLYSNLLVAYANWTGVPVLPTATMPIIVADKDPMDRMMRQIFRDQPYVVAGQ